MYYFLYIKITLFQRYTLTLTGVVVVPCDFGFVGDTIPDKINMKNC